MTVRIDPDQPDHERDMSIPATTPAAGCVMETLAGLAAVLAAVSIATALGTLAALKIAEFIWRWTQ